MIQFLLASQNMPFTVALVLMLALALLEGVATVLGAGLSDMLDSLIPDLDLDVDVDLDLDLDADVDLPDAQGPGAMTRLLGWLRLGEVPVLMLLVIFLTAFGLFGLGIQSLANTYFGGLLPGGLAALPALVCAVPVVRGLGGVLARIIPKDETEVVSEGTFIGRVAVITLGEAASGKPAEAKLTDQYGQAHYVMVEPDRAADRFGQGTEVLIVRQRGAVFTGIANPHPGLTDAEV